jgi:hypothetical protein
MKALTASIIAGSMLAATPVLAQNFDPQQALHGLLGGNQSQNQAVQQAYERGYQAGQRDAARHVNNDRGNGNYQRDTQSYGGNRPNGNQDGRYGNDSNYPSGGYNRNHGD